jgi:hypothetical protein
LRVFKASFFCRAANRADAVSAVLMSPTLEFFRFSSASSSSSVHGRGDGGRFSSSDSFSRMSRYILLFASRLPILLAAMPFHFSSTARSPPFTCQCRSTRHSQGVRGWAVQRLALGDIQYEASFPSQAQQSLVEDCSN